jgi:hypothetical protein
MGPEQAEDTEAYAVSGKNSSRKGGAHGAHQHQQINQRKTLHARSRLVLEIDSGQRNQIHSCRNSMKWK